MGTFAPLTGNVSAPGPLKPARRPALPNGQRSHALPDPNGLWARAWFGQKDTSPRATSGPGTWSPLAYEAIHHQDGAQRGPAPALQAKLEVGPVNDPLEQEADQVAERVMRMQDSRVTQAPLRVSRKCDCAAKGTGGSSVEDESLRRSTNGSSAATPIAAPLAVHGVLAKPGAPLGQATRSFFEPRFGRDFGDVRVHTDQAAEASAAEVGALAYTVGHSMVFARGQYAPGTDDGRRLMAHELAHVVQQSRSDRAIVARQPDDDASKMRSALEHSAGVASGVMTPEEFAQVKCVVREGGCPSRDGGLPDASDFATYNERCRKETGYAGSDLAPTADQCQDLPLGALDTVVPSRLKELKALIIEYAALVAAGALSADEMAAADAAIAGAEQKIGTLRPVDEPNQPPQQQPDTPPWAVTAPPGQSVPRPSVMGASLPIVGTAIGFSGRILSGAAAGTVGQAALITAAIGAGLLVMGYLLNDFLLRKEAAGAIETLIAALLTLFRKLNDAEIERRVKIKQTTKPLEKPELKDQPKGGPGPTVDPLPDLPQDRCLLEWGLPPAGSISRWTTVRAPISGNTTVLESAFRLDAGAAPPQGQDTNRECRRWARAIGNSGDDAGHVIANRFGGTVEFNTPNGNIFPQDVKINRGAMRVRDKEAADSHKAGCDVCVRIKLNYETDSALRPGSVTYSLLTRSPGAKSFNAVKTTVLANP
jgi:hypothetical protein